MRRIFGLALIGLMTTITGFSTSALGRPLKPLTDEAVPTGKAELETASRSGTGGTQTISYGYFELIDGEPFAVEDETWTFDHGGDPAEGWESKDLTASGTTNAFRRITASEWAAETGVSAPIPDGSGAAWGGFYPSEATGWSGDLGYGHSWCQRYYSDSVTYSGSGTVDLSFLYFNDTEDGFDFTRVHVRLADGTETQLVSFTDVIGNPAGSSYETYSTTIPGSTFGNVMTDFQIVFEIESDESFDDEDGFYDTDRGPFAVDNISVSGSIEDGDQFWDFEGPDEDFVAAQCGVVGDHFGIADVGEYGTGCGELSDNVVEIHDSALFHPDGQWAYLYSPAVDISTISPDSIYATFDTYALLPQEDGVYYRVGWEYYPTTPGGDEWSERMGNETWFFLGSTSYCGPLSTPVPPGDISASTERVRVVFELRADPASFGVPPCTSGNCGNFSPLLDNIQIHVVVPAATNSIAGNVFEDATDDCLPDVDGEIFTRYVQLESLDEPFVKLATVRDDGDFLFEFLDPGDYEVTLLDKSHWTQTCPADAEPHSLTLEEGVPLEGIDFGTKPDDDVVDLSAAIGSSQARPGFTFAYRAEVRNIGTMTSDSIDVVVQLPAEVNFEDATDGGVHDSGVVSWRLAGLDPETSQGLGIKVGVHQDTSLGTPLTVTATVTAPGDADGSNDSASDSTEVVGSFDPNDKHVSPEGAIETDQLLDYHINFQNVGTASAINIVVRDTLDTNVDIATLTIGAASHDYVLDIVGRELVWTFEGIELPDSASNEPDSHGWVEFTALPVAGLSPGTEIPNRAGIYFDFNEVVLTNTVISTILDPTSAVSSPLTRESNLLSWRSIAPNPSSGLATLRFSSLDSGTLTGSVFAVDGRRVRDFAARSIAVGTTDLIWDGRTNEGNLVPGGMYFVRMTLDGDAGSTTSVEARIVRVE